MKRLAIIGTVLTALTGCARKPAPNTPAATAHGVAVVESSGGKQVATAGTTLGQPVVVQVNDAQGNGVAGAAIAWLAPSGVNVEPASGVTDSSGQFTAAVTLGAMAGRYRLTASGRDATGKPINVTIEEIALDYQQTMGRQLADHYCARCHDPESTAERVSNMDNLDPKPHALTDGDALNRLSDADLLAIVSHGGPALNRSAQMPAYGYTLSKSEVEALLAYVRAVQDPQFRSQGVIYAQK